MFKLVQSTTLELQWRYYCAEGLQPSLMPVSSSSLFYDTEFGTTIRQQQPIATAVPCLIARTVLKNIPGHSV